MDLQTYCVQKGGTALRGCPVLTQLATDAGYSAETLYMVSKGHKQAGPLMAAAIDKATHSEVTRADLRPDIFGPPTPAPLGQGEEHSDAA